MAREELVQIEWAVPSHARRASGAREQTDRGATEVATDPKALATLTRQLLIYRKPQLHDHGRNPVPGMFQNGGPARKHQSNINNNDNKIKPSHSVGRRFAFYVGLFRSALFKA